MDSGTKDQSGVAGLTPDTAIERIRATLAQLDHAKTEHTSENVDQTVSGDKVNLGARIRLARAGREPGTFATELGVSTKTLGRYELGQRDPDSAVLAAVCAATGCDPNWLITGTGRAPTNGEG